MILTFLEFEDLDAATAALGVVVASAGDIVRYAAVFMMGRVLRVGRGGLRLRGRTVSGAGKTDRGTECSREHKGGPHREYEALVESHLPRSS